MRMIDRPTLEFFADRTILHVPLDKSENHSIQTLLDKIGVEADNYEFKIEKRRKRRSLNANAYYHVLVRKIALAVGATETEVHNWLLSDYGAPRLYPDGTARMVLMKDTDEWLRYSDHHVRPTNNKERRDGKVYCWFVELKPSHILDTREMARLIDGTVYEAKHLGIETMPPDQLLEMKQKWGAS